MGVMCDGKPQMTPRQNCRPHMIISDAAGESFVANSRITPGRRGLALMCYPFRDQDLEVGIVWIARGGEPEPAEHYPGFGLPFLVPLAGSVRANVQRTRLR